MLTPTSTHLANRLRVFRIGSELGITSVSNELADQIIFALENHDARVTELLEANNREVYAKREARYHLKIVITACINAAKWFRKYGELHRAKGTAESYVKARTNDLRAQYIEESVAWEVGDIYPVAPREEH